MRSEAEIRKHRDDLRAILDGLSPADEATPAQYVGLERANAAELVLSWVLQEDAGELDLSVETASRIAAEIRAER